MSKDLIINILSLITDSLSIIFGIVAIGYVIYKICGGDISGKV